MPEDQSAKEGQKQDTVHEIELPIDADLIYANGFIIGATNADVFVVLQRNGVQFGVLNMSYTLSKTLVEKLGSLIEQIESQTGHDIMNTDVASRIRGPQ